MTNAQLHRKTMNVEQARDFLGYKHRSSIYRLLEEGLLDGFRNGRRMGVRVYRDSAEKLKEAMMVEGY